jgi:hypothetical protein
MSELECKCPESTELVGGGTGSVRVRDMPPDAFGALLRAIGPEVGRLAKRGDPLAVVVMVRFVYAHNHPNDPAALLEVRTAVEDYVNRDLRVGELYDLGSRYGHQVEGEEREPTRIFVPGPESAQ